MLQLLDDEKLKFLTAKANDIRITIIEMLFSAGSGHTAGPLGMADIFSLLYFHILLHDPRNPAWEERDRLILSNGHICPVLYSAMAHAGYFSLSEVKTLRKFDSPFQGHPHREFLPAMETSSGPLGEGLSQALGMALAERMNHEDSQKFFYCVTGDGELDEGQIWEAVLLASKEKLGHLIVIVDRNNIQIDGSTDSVIPLNPLDEKFKAFNWHVVEADGNDIRSMYDAIAEAQGVLDKPSVIIARTVPGKGIPEIEHDYEWHGKAPDAIQAEKFLAVLRGKKGNE